MQCVYDCACTPASHTSSNTILWSLRAPASLKLDVCAQTLPASFAVRGNHPNPFRQTTPLVFDLPLPTLVTVEVMDVTGRRVLTAALVGLAAGWEHRIELRRRCLRDCVSLPPDCGIARGPLRAHSASGGVIVRVHRALVVHRGFLVRRASASLSFDEGSVEKRFGLIGQILTEFARGYSCL